MVAIAAGPAAPGEVGGATGGYVPPAPATAPQLQSGLPGLEGGPSYPSWVASLPPASRPGATTTTPALVPLPDVSMGTPAQLAQYNNELAAIQGPANAPGVDMSQYIGAFNNSYDSQMANIKAGLTQSLGELQGRRDQAAAITAKFPQMVNSDYANVQQAGAPAEDISQLSPLAQQAAERGSAGDANVGKLNAAAAKGDTAYQNLAITANTQSGEAALNASANNAEAGAAAQRDSAMQALDLQQMGYQDQYQLARQQAGNQFNESQIAQASQPSVVPGLTVAQYNDVSSQPSFVAASNKLTSMLTQPASYTKADYTSTLNSLTPQERAIINATNQSALNINQSLFTDPNKLAGAPPAPYSTGVSGVLSGYQQGLQQEPGALKAINPVWWGSKLASFVP